MLLAYHVAFWAWRSTTLGGIIIGLRVVRVQGTDLRFADALVRALTGCSRSPRSESDASG
jgi:uncharacterized RDD family membrane protein YckC